MREVSEMNKFEIEKELRYLTSFGELEMLNALTEFMQDIPIERLERIHELTNALMQEKSERWNKAFWFEVDWRDCVDDEIYRRNYEVSEGDIKCPE